MKRAVLCLILASLSFSVSAQTSFYHDYKSFFGKEDRVGLFSEDAKARFSPKVLKTIAANTLLVDCGTKDKPATGFLGKTHDGTHIVTAAHNAQMAAQAKPCQAKRFNETAIEVSDIEINSSFQDNATLTDVGFDIAKSKATALFGGFETCKNIDITSTFIVPQSYDGTGYLALPPTCRVTNITKTVITTTCKGHYKASGAPLLSVQENNVCVAGVFNAHSGSLMKYESYAANITSQE